MTDTPSSAAAQAPLECVLWHLRLEFGDLLTDNDRKTAVRLVLAAIREPSGEMVSAACQVPDYNDGRRMIGDMWRAMMDVLLKDAGE